jgi:thiamine biosynthesis lipoprotein
MGSVVHVVAVGSSATPARRLVEELEHRWSRFRPDSEISRVNAAGGRPVRVSSWTTTLLDAARTAWHATGGAFDPTVAAAMDANGYGGRSGVHRGAAPGMGGCEVDEQAGAVRLPAGVTFDPGGIGKGLAADLAVTALAEAGAAGALVSVGGDVRVWGHAPRGDVWSLGVQDPFEPDRDVAVVALGDGAVASSSCLGRCWELDGAPMHHIVDPATGAPLANDRVAATAVAGTAWWAEVLTKAALVGDGSSALVARDAALVWQRDGACRAVGRVREFFRTIDGSVFGTEVGA